MFLKYLLSFYSYDSTKKLIKMSLQNIVQIQCLSSMKIDYTGIIVFLFEMPKLPTV